MGQGRAAQFRPPPRQARNKKAVAKHHDSFFKERQAEPFVKHRRSLTGSFSVVAYAVAPAVHVEPLPSAS